jgi:hypothetical protein
MYYKTGMTVMVNKDITRVAYVNNKPQFNTKYAQCGEIGEIIEIFRPIGTGGGEIKPLSAKVLINNEIKTFRLTSLDII